MNYYVLLPKPVANIIIFCSAAHFNTILHNIPNTLSLAEERATRLSNQNSQSNEQSESNINRTDRQQQREVDTQTDSILESDRETATSSDSNGVSQEDGSSEQSSEVDKSALLFRDGDIETEEQEIINNAKANGTYLKAPNGKDTNLSPHQWVQVRTKAFIKWFGDWEKAAIRDFLLSGKSVSNLSGEEFSKRDDVTFIEQVTDFFINQGDASSLFGVVKLDKKGIKNSRSHGISRSKAVAFAAVKDVLEQGQIMLPMGYYGTSNKKQSTGIIAAPITINGERKICTVVVIRNNKDNKLYVHEVFSGENLQMSVATSPIHDSNATSSQTQGDIAKVLEDIINSKPSSKVIDSNGEPLVVYHGTDSEFTKFDINEVRDAEGSFFFTESIEEAEAYSGYGNTMPLFVSV